MVDASQEGDLGKEAAGECCSRRRMVGSMHRHHACAQLDSLAVLYMLAQPTRLSAPALSLPTRRTMPGGRAAVRLSAGPQLPAQDVYRRWLLRQYRCLHDAHARADAERGRSAGFTGCCGDYDHAFDAVDLRTLSALCVRRGTAARCCM
jgi:hypothetical protein